MKCSQCQTDNPEGKKFCRKCGTRLSLTCQQCGAEILSDDLFCGDCGQDLRAPKETPPIDYSAPHSYTPKHLAEKILTTRSAMEGERKLVTVLFADVADFTAMSEKLDPEEVHEIMDRCFRVLMDEIHRYEGTINQFTGDGVMALFGAPVAHEDHAQRACHAALNAQKALSEYGERVTKEYGIEFRMRMGLNSGPVIVGAIGDDLRMDYTAVGDTTNLASRMEHLARPGAILVSRNTHRLARDYFEFHPSGQVEVKGKEEPQETFELIKTGEVETRIGASVARGLTRFVGRKNSMAALMEPYEKVKAGSGQVVGVVGEAGVGKSRLLLEFRNRLPEDEFTYLEGHCIHYGANVPYLPVLDFLRSYFGIVEGERQALIRKKVSEKVLGLDPNLSQTLAPLQDLLSLKVEDEAYLSLEPKQRRERGFEALRDLLLRGSQVRLIILAVEDLHWIDRTTEEFLDYFIGWMANAKILLVLLYRPEYTHQWASRSYYNHIGLDQLTLESSAELVKAILEGGETAPELRDLILNRAAGNPLFMEELTHTLLENGSIQKEQDQYVLACSPSELQVPDTVQGIIAARIDRLEETLKRTMQVASVIGREFAFRILQTIIGMREELKAHLLNLQGLEFIYEKQLFPELEYIFKHALTQEVAYNSLLSTRRKELHRRIGMAIEELHAGSLEEFFEVLAYHYSKGEETGKACHYLKLSGNKATRNHALREAYGFYREAAQLLKTLPENEEQKEERIQVLELMIPPAGIMGFPEDSLSFFEQGKRLAKELGDSLSLARFHAAIGSLYSHAGNHSRAIEYTEVAFEEARKAQDIDAIAPLAFSLCMTYLGTGECLKIVDKAPGVIDLMERTRTEALSISGAVYRYSALCGACGLALGHLGRFEEGEAFLEKGLRNAIRVNHLPTLGLTEFYYSMLHYTKGDWRSAKAHLEKSTAHCEKAKFHLVLANSLLEGGSVSSFLGDPEAGRRLAEKGLQMYRQSGTELFFSYWHWVIGGIYLDVGDLENARVSMEASLTFSRKNHEKGWEGLSWSGLGRVLGKQKPREIKKVERCFIKGLDLLDDHAAKPWYAQGHLFLGEFYLEAGEKEKAMENLKRAERLFQEMGMDYWLERTRRLLEGA